MLLVVDTETSGLLRDDLPADDPSQPHLVQLGAQLFDRQGARRANLTTLIKPEGWSIEPQAEAVHGISAQTCQRYGVSVVFALGVLQGLVACSTRVVAHNMNFDRKVIAAAIHRAGGQGLWWSRAGGRMVCTMEAATPVLKLEGKFGHKFPSLAEAMAGLCPAFPFDERHDAEADVMATRELYQTLLQMGAIPPDAGGFNRRIE